MRKSSAKNSQRQLFIFAAILFISSIILRSCLAVYDKRLQTYNDELRYWQIAKSIWNNGNFDIYSVKNNFSKIFYSVLLAPFFAIKNSILRVKAISAFNAFLVSSSLMPGYLIAKRITKNKYASAISLIILFLLPDMCYSMTFMSETLYLPMGLWQIYFTICLVQEKNIKRKTVFSVLNGIYSYLLYLTKEVSLIFVIAYCIIEIAPVLTERKNTKRRIIPLLCYIISFGLAFVLAKATIFSGMGNSYSQTSLSQLDSLYKLEYFIYALIYNGIFVVIAYFFFPLIYPAIRFKSLDRTKKVLFLYTILCILLNMAIIAFTITVREDLGKIAPRQHHRYYAPLFYPLVLIFFDCLFTDKTKEEKSLKWVAPVSVVFMVLAAAVPKIPSTIVNVDSTIIKYYLKLTTQSFKNISDGFGELIINNGLVFFKIIVIAAAVTGTVVICIKNKKAAAVYFTFLILMTEGINNFITADTFKKSTSVTHSQQDEAYRLDNYLKNVNGNILFIQNELYSADSKLADTYLSVDYCAVLKNEVFDAMGDNDYLDLKNSSLTPAYRVQGVPNYQFNSIDYVLSDSELSFDDDKAVEINIEGVYCIHVYQLTDKERLWLNK